VDGDEPGEDARSVAMWNRLDNQGQVVGNGISDAEHGDDGLLLAITGFFAQ
jgi:hypothetical protein